MRVKNSSVASAMRREKTKQTLKLRVLAFMLALALVWYSLNPAPRPVVRKTPKAEPPDEKQRIVEPHSMSATLEVVFRPMGEVAKPELIPGAGEEDFEWPEFIDG